MFKPVSGYIALLCTGLILSLLLSLSGCAAKQSELLDPDDLSGKTVGVILGNSPDYILTNAGTGAEVRRYDSNGEMMLALAFHQLDAAAMERDEADVFCLLQPEYRVHSTFVRKERYAYVLDPLRSELNEQFNAFVAEFRESAQYRDIVERMAECAWRIFRSRPVESRGEGDSVLKVLVYEDWEPISYFNPEANRWEGADVELMTHFANSIGAGIEFHAVGSYTQAVLDLRFGKADVLASPDSLQIKTDLEKAGNVTMSDWVWEKEIVFIVNSADWQK